MTSIADIEKQIAELEKQKAAVIAEEKDAALDKVKVALAELNALGFNYKLVEAGATTSTPRVRRTGLKQNVLMEIKRRNNGISVADLLKNLQLDKDNDKTALQNALSALKKAGDITSPSRGIYKAV